MAESALQGYLYLTPQQIYTQLMDILLRELPLPGKRQAPFNAVETLLCYGLFSLVDPHRYGGANIDRVPAIVAPWQYSFAALLCGRTCVFCGFAPYTLPDRNGLLRASHIKPWAVSNQRERVDVHNGLVACPLHDAAFDQGYLAIDDSYHIRKSKLLLESIEHGDYQVGLFFEEALRMNLLLPSSAKMPAQEYLEYHRLHCFRG
jgi:hypothetical protein